jgi:hypothetical protein
MTSFDKRKGKTSILLLQPLLVVITILDPIPATSHQPPASMMKRISPSYYYYTIVLVVVLVVE